MSTPVFVVVVLFGLFGFACCITAIAVLVVEAWEHHQREKLGAEAEAFLAREVAR